MYTSPFPSGQEPVGTPQPVQMAGNATLVPSGRTPNSGTRPPTTGPPYTISFPSGDHTGLTT